MGLSRLEGTNATALASHCPDRGSCIGTGTAWTVAPPRTSDGYGAPVTYCGRDTTTSLSSLAALTRSCRYGPLYRSGPRASNPTSGPKGGTYSWAISVAVRQVEPDRDDDAVGRPMVATCSDLARPGNGLDVHDPPAVISDPYAGARRKPFR
jgi:hypothetical protein